MSSSSPPLYFFRGTCFEAKCSHWNIIEHTITKSSGIFGGTKTISNGNSASCACLNKGSLVVIDSRNVQLKGFSQSKTCSCGNIIIYSWNDCLNSKFAGSLDGIKYPCNKCPECNGIGYRSKRSFTKCSNCDGTGGERCNPCNGNGYTLSNNYQAVDGLSGLTVLTTQNCSNCQGRGFFHICEDCNRTGVKTKISANINCSSCVPSK